MRVDFVADDDTVIVSETPGEHNDEPVEALALSDATKKLILEYSESGLLPMRILAALVVNLKQYD